MAELQTWSREEIAVAAERIALAGLSTRPPEEVTAALRLGALELAKSLSPREMQILHGLAEGKTGTQIAAELFVSYATVKTFTSRLFDKLGACNAASAVDRAYRAGILTVEASDG